MNLGPFSPPFLFAQGGGDAEAAGAIMILGAFFLVALFIGLAVQCLIIYLVYNAYLGCPPQHRLMEPWQCWLLLIPCFNLVWNFFVFQKIPESYRNFFTAAGRHDQGDCGQQLGLWYAIVVCISIVLGAPAGIAALVMMIIFIVKMYELKRIATEVGYMPEKGGAYAGDFGKLADPHNPYASPGDSGGDYGQR